MRLFVVDDEFCVNCEVLNKGVPSSPCMVCRRLGVRQGGVGGVPAPLLSLQRKREEEREKEIRKHDLTTSAGCVQSQITTPFDDTT